MGYLIYKDIYQTRKIILIYMILGMLFAFVGINSGNTVMLAIPILLIVYSALARNEIYEDKNKGYEFLKTLPIKPYKIVVSKFITAFILTLVGTWYALMLIIFFGDDITLNQAFTIILPSCGITLIFAGMFYAMVYKLGAVKAINIIGFIFISFAFVPFLIKLLVESLFSKEVITEFFQKVSNISLDGYIAFTIVIGIYLLLMLLSIKVFYKNR